ncbi:GNAT family N-acetyltransferase [Actinoplanes sp. CA-054009]
MQITTQLANCRSYWLGWSTGPAVDDDLTMYRSGLRHPVMNGVLRLRGHDVAAAAERARRYFGDLPWVWWVGADSEPGVAGALLALGAEQIDREPVMAIDLARLPDRSAPAGLRIEKAESPDRIAAFVEAYVEPMGLGRELAPGATVIESGRHDLVRFTGTLDGRVVGTSVLAVSDGVAGIYVVSTGEAYRHRGIATAMTLAALRAGRDQGLRVGTLQATAEGEPVYRKLGFEVVGEYRVFQV